MGDARSGGNVTGWLLALMRAQLALPRAWGCYYQVTPAIAHNVFDKWVVDCLHFGNDTADAAATIAPLRAAWDAHPARGMSWNLTTYASFWGYKRGDNGGDTTGVAAVLTSRILPATAFAPGSVEVIVASLIGAVQRVSDHLPSKQQSGFRFA